LRFRDQGHLIRNPGVAALRQQPQAGIPNAFGVEHPPSEGSADLRRHRLAGFPERG
jgi:hypothetical protein